MAEHKKKIFHNAELSLFSRPRGQECKAKYQVAGMSSHLQIVIGLSSAPMPEQQSRLYCPRSRDFLAMSLAIHLSNEIDSPFASSLRLSQGAHPFLSLPSLNVRCWYPNDIQMYEVLKGASADVMRSQTMKYISNEQHCGTGPFSTSICYRWVPNPTETLNKYQLRPKETPPWRVSST
jgi:hypothetical protein